MIARPAFAFTTTALLVVALPAASSAHSGSPGPGGGKPVVGARSLGDPLLPQIGNGGYDVKHYRIYLDYDPGRTRSTRRGPRSMPGRNRRSSSSRWTSRVSTSPA